MSVTIIGCPTELGLRRETPGVPSGTVHAPDALRAAGVVERLGATDAGNLPVPAYDAVRRVPAGAAGFRPPSPLGGLKPAAPREPGVLNEAAVHAFAETQAAAIGAVLDRGAFPLILGGDCSLLLGSMQAVQRRGRYGLLFLDGHTDYYTPETSGTGGIAGMDLYFACRSLVDPRHVVHLGRRDYDEARAYRGELPAEVLDVHLDLARGLGPRKAAERAMRHLQALDGWFIHLDVDVLDDAFMPCVDSRQPGGLTPAELRELLEVLCQRAVAAEITIFDPTKDATGDAARGLVDILTVFAS